jgi:hypothetical protein
VGATARIAGFERSIPYHFVTSACMVADPHVVVLGGEQRHRPSVVGRLKNAGRTERAVDLAAHDRAIEHAG